MHNYQGLFNLKSIRPFNYLDNSALFQKNSITIENKMHHEPWRRKEALKYQELVRKMQTKTEKTQTVIIIGKLKDKMAKDDL